MLCSGTIATASCVASSTITRHLSKRPPATRSNTKSIDHTSLAAWGRINGWRSLIGTFFAKENGPHFGMNLAIQNTEFPAMNDLLRAYGRFDVKAGMFSVYSQMGVKDGDLNGYVKPMFSDLQFYDWDKDKRKNVLQQAKQLALGAAAKLLKSGKTGQVASQVTLTGKLKNPNTSTWEAVVELLQNAFIQAILPGFDREAAARAQAASQ